MNGTHFVQQAREPDGRYAVTLNIGLRNNPWHDVTQDLFAQLIAQGFARRVDGVEDTLVNVAYYDDYAAPGEHPRAGFRQSDAVTEPTAVVVFDVEPFDRCKFEHALTALARELAQGAIAYMAHPLEGPNYADVTGLVGPHAQRWGGAFDERYFQEFDEWHVNFGAHMIEPEAQVSVE